MYLKTKYCLKHINLNFRKFTHLKLDEAGCSWHPLVGLSQGTGQGPGRHDRLRESRQPWEGRAARRCSGGSPDQRWAPGTHHLASRLFP